jgi:hypothetical protein
MTDVDSTWLANFNISAIRAERAMYSNAKSQPALLTPPPTLSTYPIDPREAEVVTIDAGFSVSVPELLKVQSLSVLVQEVLLMGLWVSHSGEAPGSNAVDIFLRLVSAPALPLFPTYRDPQLCPAIDLELL